MKIQDRIKEFRRVPAKELRPNPKNWRAHPKTQQDALKGILAEVGIADALLVRELPDGSLMLLDGHLRAEVLPDQEIPVLILDVTGEEADKILLTHDAITGMAEIDEAQLIELMESTAIEAQAVIDMLNEMVELTPDDVYGEDEEETKSAPKSKPIPEILQIVVTCRDIEHQEELYNRFTEEGLECKLMNL